MQRVGCAARRIFQKNFLIRSIPVCPLIISNRLLRDENKNYGVDQGGKYKIFRDEDATIILDVEEERALEKTIEREPLVDEFKGLNMRRGVQGVFDIEDLVELLERDKGQDLCVLRVPEELNYVDYMVVVTGRSRRHILALAEFVRKVFKKKCNPSDILPRLEGESSEWIALDLGNIALHIMSHEARLKYDLESLWSVGVRYDTVMNEPEQELLQLLNKHSINLDDFQPADKHG